MKDSAPLDVENRRPRLDDGDGSETKGLRANMRAMPIAVCIISPESKSSPDWREDSLDSAGSDDVTNKVPCM